jgi:hypothetical protein
MTDGERYVDRMSGVIVIVAYRPKPGKERELLELVCNRVLVPDEIVEGLRPDIFARKPESLRAQSSISTGARKQNFESRASIHAVPRQTARSKP